MGAIEKQVAVVLVSLLVLGGLTIGYTLAEPALRDTRGQQMLEHSAMRGGELFHSQGCIQCHLDNGYGTLQGGVGWPLNTTENQRGSATELENRRQLLYRTIERGRGPVMAAYHRENGGSLNSEQITEIVSYIQYGHWPTAPVEGAAAQLVQQGGAAAGTGGAAGGSRGAQLFTSNGCVGCHQIGGQGGATGPNLTNVGSVAGTRKPGMEARDYIRESITNPNAFVVQGFQPNVMPSFAQLPPADVDALTDYLLEQK